MDSMKECRHDMFIPGERSCFLYARNTRCAPVRLTAEVMRNRLMGSCKSVYDTASPKTHKGSGQLGFPELKAEKRPRLCNTKLRHGGMQNPSDLEAKLNFWRKLLAPKFVGARLKYEGGITSLIVLVVVEAELNLWLSSWPPKFCGSLDKR
jgi:hypothetical protein